jgi:GT2 family glycosyltransferase
LEENSLKQAAHFFEDKPEISVVGTTIYDPNGEVWFASGEFVRKNGTIIGTDQRLPASLPYMKADWVSGCSMLINLKRFPDRCPQFDPDYFLYYEDFDFCQRYARQGHIIGVTRKIGVIQQPSSMTNRHLDLKLQHSICSYLIALEKHTSRFVLLYRLVLTFFSALVSVPANRKEAINKLKGVFMYCQRVVRRLRAPVTRNFS